MNRACAPATPAVHRAALRPGMRRPSHLAASLVLGLIALLMCGSALAQQPTRWVAGELLVGFRAGVGPAGRFALFRDQGASFVEDIGTTRVVRIRVPVMLLDVVKRVLERRPEVKFVEKNFEFTTAMVPNDAQYPSQWHLPKMQAAQAWDITQGAPGTVIAILDSGIDAAHPDFAGKLVAGYNTYSNSTDTTDPFGHGTEVAGAAGALTNNALGVAGVAGAAPIMPVRVTNAAGAATSASIANGIIWATDHGARVVNVSFGGVAGNATIRAAAEYAHNRGTLVVAASGNCGCADPTPDNPFMLSVSATDESDALAYFSTTGPFVDLSAPGTNILTTALFGTYFAESGTSLASPLVAGVASLMFAANPAITPAQAAQLLEASAVDLGGSGYDEEFGYGRVNASAAVTAAAGYTPPQDTTPPTAALTAPLAGATVSATAVVAAAADDNVGVTKVDLYVDGVFFVSDAVSPYSFAWDTTAVSNGTHTLHAVATDAAGNAASSAMVSVTVSNTPPDTTAPTVSIAAPTAGATVSGTTTVTGNAADAVGVTKVEFYVDGVLGVTDTSAPYSFAWNTSTLPNGVHTLQARAYDAANNIGTSSLVSVTVSNAVADTTPPVVSIGAPAAGATVSGSTTVSAAATDNVGVTRVELYVDGVLYGTDTTAPYSFAWNTAPWVNGSHTLQVRAFDAAGNATNATRTVTVANNRAPVATNDSFTAPYRATLVYAARVLSVLTNDSDADGTLNAATVKIVSSPNKGGTATANANGTVSYKPKIGYRGAETFTYNVKDNLGATSNTATVTVNVP